MSSNLMGKVALVTGSTQGLGLGIATVLAASGANVVLNGMGDPSKIEQVRKNLENTHKVRVYFDGTDLRNPTAIKEMVLRASGYGQLGILVNNAGIQHVSPIEDFSDEKYNDVIAVNLSSSFHTIKHAVPIMKKAGWGRIINIASAHGQVASVNKSAYVASKHGVLGLTKAVALELAKTHITVNSICPGWVITDLVVAQIKKKAEALNISYEEMEKRFIEEKHPSGVAVDALDVGEAVKFLCSDAAREIRGASLNMDGGWWAV